MWMSLKGGLVRFSKPFKNKHKPSQARLTDTGYTAALPGFECMKWAADNMI